MARKKNRTFLAGLAIIVAAAVYVMYAQSITNFDKGPLLADSMSTEGFMEVRPTAGVSDGDGVLQLSGGCYSLAAGTDPYIANSIANGLQGTVEERPNSHDVARDIIETLDADVIMVKITNIRDNNFLGRLVISQGNKILDLDVRPSDGVAIAVRMNATIYMNETLMKEYGRNTC